MLSYSPGNTIVHSIDARVKILWLFVILGIIFSSRTMDTAILSLLFVGFSCALAYISPFALFPRLKFLLFLLVVPFLFGLVFVSPLFGVINSIILLAALSFSILFIMTTEQRKIVAALQFYKVPASTAFSLSMSLHFLPVFERKFYSVRVAQASRGHSGRNPVPLVVPLMHSVMRKAMNLSLSMDARAFDSERVQLTHKLRMKPLDWAALFILFLVIAAKIKTL